MELLTAVPTELPMRSDELNDPSPPPTYGGPEGAWRDENETLKPLLALNQDVTLYPVAPIVH